MKERARGRAERPAGGSRRLLAGLLMLLGAIVGAGTVSACGSSSSAVTAPTVQPARVFTLGRFSPTTTVQPRHPVQVTFTVRLPSGKPLTSYRTGSGPHTGVHLIIVRKDLAYIIHDHPPVGPDGVLRQRVIFPAPGPYRVLVDVYPDIPGGQPNFQLFGTVNVAGAYHPVPLPPFKGDQVVGGYHFHMQGNPHLHAIQAAFVHVDVTDPRGRPVKFVPWFGALAHAIFFHQGSLDYFHTHVCAPNAPNCSSLLGAAKVTGRANAPGKLSLGILLPVPGTWRLFLQMKPRGRVLTAPFTLRVS